MFIRRYHITEGATTTAGGVVRTSNKFSRINGAAMVLEGDPVDCPACGGQGVIKCVTPRISDRLNGKEYALSDDLCICGCNPPPKLIAAQNLRSQYFLVADKEPAEVVAKRQSGEAGNGAAPAAHGDKQAESRPLRFVIRGIDKPHANKRYRLDLTEGRVVQGTTDSDGDTRPLTPDEESALRTWPSGQR